MSDSSQRRRCRRRLRPFGIVVAVTTALFMLTLLAPASVDAFQLRDPTQKVDVTAAGGGKSRPVRTIYKDMPMRRITRIVHDIDPDERLDVDGQPIDSEDEGDDGSEDSGQRETYAFEKVHSTHFDLPPPRPVTTLSQPDIEQEAEEAQEEAESGEQVSSVLDPVWQVAELVGEWVPSTLLDDLDVLQWLQMFQKTPADEPKDDASNEDATAEDSAPGFWSYLDRKPFNILLKYIGQEHLLDRADGNAANSAEDATSAEQRQPLSVQHFEDLLLTVPSFVPNYTNVENMECRRMGQIFQRQVRGEKLWALQMIDASAKIPSGLLRGNVNQLGDFDQCMEIRTKVKLKEDKSVKIKGKYCLANIDVEATIDDMRLPVHLLQGRNMLRSHLDDPAHFLPRFSTIKWALCIPNACSANDAQSMLAAHLSKFDETAGVRLSVQIDDEDCVVRIRRTWSDLIKANWQMSVAIGYFTFFVVVTVIASLNDYWKLLKLDVLLADPNIKTTSKSDPIDATTAVEDNAENENEQVNDELTPDELREENGMPAATDEQTVESDDSGTKCETCNEDHGFTHRMLMSFSLKHTMHTLFSFEPAPNDDDIIYCIYGLKGLATVLLYFSLKALLTGHVPYSNRTQMTEQSNHPLSVLLRVGALLYSDVFLLASGFFAGYKMNGDLSVRHRIPWLRRIGARTVRLLPAVLAVVLFTGWIWPHLGAGPQWSQLVGRNAELCRSSAGWSHLLFVQNLLPAHEQCAPHLAHIAVDMQLFVLAPAIVWLLDRNVALGFGVFGVLNAFAVGVRFARTVNERLSVVVFHGMKLTQFYRTINSTLASPLQRATAHLVGLGLGVMLSQTGRDVQIPKAIFVTGWLTCLWSFIWCLWAPAHLAHKDYVYDPAEAAQFSTWAPLMWSLAISWVVFVVFTRNDGLMTRCLTARPLIFLSRISYQVFCVQALVLLAGAASVRSADVFSWGTLFNVQEIVLVLGAATVCTLVFDLPLQAISRMILAQGIDDDIAAEAERLQAEADATEAREKADVDASTSDTEERPTTPAEEDGIESASDDCEQTDDLIRKVSFAPTTTGKTSDASDDDDQHDEKAKSLDAEITDEPEEEPNSEPEVESEPASVSDVIAEDAEDNAEDESEVSELVTVTNGSPTQDDEEERDSEEEVHHLPATSGESRAYFEEEYDDDDDVEDGIQISGIGNGTNDIFSDSDEDDMEDIRARMWRNNY